MGIIEAQNLVVERGGKTVLNGVSLSIERGEVFAMLGGNGAGKSTTLLALLGFLPPVSGELRVQETAVYENVRKIREAIAFLPESVALYSHLSARPDRPR